MKFLAHKRQLLNTEIVVQTPNVGTNTQRIPSTQLRKKFEKLRKTTEKQKDVKQLIWLRALFILSK